MLNIPSCGNQINQQSTAHHWAYQPLRDQHPARVLTCIFLEVSMNLANANTPLRRSGSFFQAAIEKAKASVAQGGALSYAVDQCPHRGRIIKLETANGWSPYPLFVERPH